eukprot:TRINITY_DN19566_c0_g1_i1.p1 TRINITY_DN19566_c0_g1~~TRINITY_DN19566_c0_g1_i1.p1  ORF type:complete len:343 (-),score=58.74 TRINITY_DN19566_c0_g1_i1:187-1215(-)
MIRVGAAVAVGVVASVALTVINTTHTIEGAEEYGSKLKAATEIADPSLAAPAYPEEADVQLAGLLLEAQSTAVDLAELWSVGSSWRPDATVVEALRRPQATKERLQAQLLARIEEIWPIYSQHPTPVGRAAEAEGRAASAAASEMDSVHRRISLRMTTTMPPQFASAGADSSNGSGKSVAEFSAVEALLLPGLHAPASTSTSSGDPESHAAALQRSTERATVEVTAEQSGRPTTWQLQEETVGERSLPTGRLDAEDSDRSRDGVRFEGASLEAAQRAQAMLLLRARHHQFHALWLVIPCGSAVGLGMLIYIAKEAALADAPSPVGLAGVACSRRADRPLSRP